MFKALFKNVSEEEKNNAIANIVQHGSPRQDFFFMLTLSIAMAVFGVLLESTVILIGSMLIAPLLYPILSLALGVTTADGELMASSFKTLLKSIGFGLVAGFLITIVFAGSQDQIEYPLGIIAGDTQSLMYAVVAVISGLAGAFAVIKPNLNETLPGVAISVALVPPLAVAGVGIAYLNWEIVSNASLLFIVNVIGILFSAMIVFSLLRFPLKRTVTQKEVKKEEKVLKEEKEKEGEAS